MLRWGRMAVVGGRGALSSWDVFPHVWAGTGFGHAVLIHGNSTIDPVSSHSVSVYRGMMGFVFVVGFDSKSCGW